MKFAKPLAPQTLIHKAPHPYTGLAQARKAPTRPSVLIVDDTPDNLLLLSGLLKQDYRVRLAQTGAKALDICTGDDPPDLMLLEIIMVRLAEETTLQVLGMINLSAKLFKIETGRFELQAEPVKIADILRRIAQVCRSAYASKRLTISVDTDVPVGEEQPQSSGDAMLCYSLFQNLLKNACEAAPAGTKVSIALLSQSPLRIIIENNGAVLRDMRERFFEKSMTSGKAGGTGLGAYLAKLLTEAQGGSVELAVSDVMNTTAVTVVLPNHVGGR